MKIGFVVSIQFSWQHVHIIKKKSFKLGLTDKLTGNFSKIKYLMGKEKKVYLSPTGFPSKLRLRQQRGKSSHYGCPGSV